MLLLKAHSCTASNPSSYFAYFLPPLLVLPCSFISTSFFSPFPPLVPVTEATLFLVTVKPNVLNPAPAPEEGLFVTSDCWVERRVEVRLDRVEEVVEVDEEGVETTVEVGDDRRRLSGFEEVDGGGISIENEGFGGRGRVGMRLGVGCESCRREEGRALGLAIGFEFGTLILTDCNGFACLSNLTLISSSILSFSFLTSSTNS